jgi:hypothetical protein
VEAGADMDGGEATHSRIHGVTPLASRRGVFAIG